MTDTDTIVERKPDTYRGEPGDADRFSHYVPKAQLEQAILSGVPTTALCGKKWLPTRDAKRFLVCQACKDAYDQLPDGPTA